MAGLAKGAGGDTDGVANAKTMEWERELDSVRFSLCIARISEDWVSEHIEGNPRDISFHSAEGLASPKLWVSVSCVMEGLES